MKRIIIIGASSGLGHRLAVDFAEMGWTVGVAARRNELLEEMCSPYPGRMFACKMDVASDDAPSALANLIERCGGMDTLLYAAGTGWHNPFVDPATEVRTVDVNVLGFTRIVDAAYQYFRQEGRGQIAVLTSVAGTKGLGVAPAYSASKRYQWNYLQALDQLAKSEGMKLTVTDIRPGFMDTALLASDPNRGRLPLLMSVDYAAPRIERAILRRRRVAYVDWRWHTLCALWRRIPNCLWRLGRPL